MRTRLLLVIPLLAACAGDDGGGSRRSAGGGDPRPLTGDRPSAPPTVASFSADTRAFMEDGLRQFSREDPRWETTRAQWIAMGPREAEFLVQNLWAALLAAQSINQPHLVERARHELALIGPPSVPLMSDVLAAGSVRMSDASGASREVAIDDMQRAEASEILSIIGGPAVPALADALGRAESKGGKRFLLTTLGNIGDRGGDAASRPLVRFARDPDDVLRIEAVRGLRSFGDDATRNALFAALGDAESLVAVMAAESLVVRKDVAAAPAIRQAAERAKASLRLRDAQKLERCATLLEKPVR